MNGVYPQLHLHLFDLDGLSDSVLIVTKKSKIMKKIAYHYYIFAFLVVTLLLWLWYYYKNINSVSGVKNIAIEHKNSTLSFSDKWIKIGKNYEYYQVYIYPSKYSILCESKNKQICDEIGKKQDKVKKYILNYISKDLSTSPLGKNEIKVLENNEKMMTTLNDLFQLLYKWNHGNNTEKVSQYFEYKKESQTPINPMEIQCLENIMTTVTEWSYNAEEEIKQRVTNECKAFENTSNILSNNNTIKKAYPEETVKFWINIEEVKLEYKFFTKNNGQFTEQYNEDVLVPLKKNAIKVMSLWN